MLEFNGIIYPLPEGLFFSFLQEHTLGFQYFFMGVFLQLLIIYQLIGKETLIKRLWRFLIN
jgi:hypothetical protein